MKKALLIVVVLLVGCAAPAANTIPAGKTGDDWSRDESYCIEQSGYVTGFWSTTTPGMLKNIEARPKYEQCLRELGWIK